MTGAILKQCRFLGLSLSDSDSIGLGYGGDCSFSQAFLFRYPWNSTVLWYVSNLKTAITISEF
jgi:hypothetical protein